MKRSKSEKVLGVLLLACALGVGCSKRPAANVMSDGSTNSTPSTNSTSPVGKRVATDDIGRRVVMPLKLTRVVSTAPSITENIFAVGAGDRLVGVTTFCNFPEEAKAIAKIGDTMTPNMESIVALKPDVVFVSTASQLEAFTKMLEQNGISVYVTNPTSLYEVIQSLQHLSILFGTETVTRQLTSSMMERSGKIENLFGMHRDEPVASYKKRISLVKVFVQISREPLFTIGNTGLLEDLINQAGGRSVTPDISGAYPKLSKETASALNPEVIILSDSEDNQEPNDAFKNSPAVKNGRVYKINADIISRPGPRLVDALEQIARDLHPDKFQ